MSVHEEASRIAERQHGLITVAQALEIGMTPKQIRTNKRTGRWVPLRWGVHVVNGAPRTKDQRVMAAVLAYGPDAVASHTTAGDIHGLITNQRPVVDVMLAHAQHRRSRRGIKPHQANLDPSDVTVVRNIPVTSIERTLVDLAGVVPPRTLAAALDTSLVRRLTTIDAVERFILARRLSRKRGVGTLRRLLADRRDGIPESYLERLFLEKAERHGLRLPERQYRSGRRRIDLVYRPEMVAIELDGRVHHSTADDFQDDRTKVVELVSDGFVPLLFTYQDVTRRWSYVQRSIEGVLAARAPNARPSLPSGGRDGLAQERKRENPVDGQG